MSVFFVCYYIAVPGIHRLSYVTRDALEGWRRGSDAAPSSPSQALPFNWLVSLIMVRLFRFFLLHYGDLQRFAVLTRLPHSPMGCCGTCRGYLCVRTLDANSGHAGGGSRVEGAGGERMGEFNRKKGDLRSESFTQLLLTDLHVPRQRKGKR